MQFSARSPRTGPVVAIGIHDLLEQSISRSRLGVSHDSAAALPQSNLNPQQTRPSTSASSPRSKSGRVQESAELHTATASQAATPRASTASWEEDSIGHMSRTTMPERRQIEYTSSGSSTNHAVDIASTGKRSAHPQVCLVIQKLDC